MIFNFSNFQINFRENTENYQPNLWGHSGPGAVTRVLQRICNQTHVEDMTLERCGGFKVFPPSTFFPIDYNNWAEFYDTNQSVVESTLKASQDSIAVHMWNKMSNGIKVVKSKDAKSAFQIMAQKNCPKVFDATELHFW